jgi:hypothetical protein
MGSSWLGSSWFGSSWLGSSWTGGGDSGGVPTFPMRDDAPIAATPVTSNFNAKFRDSEWDSDLLALTILQQFIRVTIPASGSGAKTWEQTAIARLTTAGGPTTPITQAMIDDLLLKTVTDRPEAMGEILQEHNNFQVRFLQLLSISGSSHPKTLLLMKLAARVGEFAMMYLKRLKPPSSGPTADAPWNLRERPRPSQVCSTIFPPVPVPGHSSYPAGHALIAWLTTKCLEDIPALSASPYKESLELFADRVGKNRVIAGLHFQQDVDHGKLAGIAIFPYIQQCPLYSHTLTAAKNEWI